jgi:hypothetical protein
MKVEGWIVITSWKTLTAIDEDLEDLEDVNNGEEEEDNTKIKPLEDEAVKEDSKPWWRNSTDEVIKDKGRGKYIMQRVWKTKAEVEREKNLTRKSTDELVKAYDEKIAEIKKREQESENKRRMELVQRARVEKANERKEKSKEKWQKRIKKWKKKSWQKLNVEYVNRKAILD